MFDIFYQGNRPGVTGIEQQACSVEQAAKLCRTRFFWWIHYLADLDNWDFSWEPPPWQAHQRHAWASQWQQDSGVYLIPAAGYSDTCYHAEIILRRADMSVWQVPYKIDTQHFDFSWHPDPADPPYIHEFATQWWDQGGPQYRVPGAVEIKYHAQPKARLREYHDRCWHTLETCEWDYSWVPHPKDPPLIYVFGNQWWPAEKWPTVEYHVPGAVAKKYMTYPQARLLHNSDGWTKLCELDFDFDYSWKPDPGDPPYRYWFGNQWHSAEVMPTLEYQHPMATQHSAVKYVDWPRAKLGPNARNWTVPDGLTNVDLSWVPDPGAPPYVYQFGTQHQKTGGPVYRQPGATEIAYVSRPRATKVSVDPCWTLPPGMAVASVDLTWHPDATEQPYIYQFATQHQKTGGAVYAVPGAQEIKYLENIRTVINSDTVPVIEIDHMDGHSGQITSIKKIRYFDNYRDTLIRLAKSLVGQYEWVWVCSSVCDYSDFDFSWHPEQWQQTMLHVFASNDQKFGDTFYMHVPTFAARAEKKALLEWYDVNFVNISVPRRPMPVYVHQHDSQVTAVQTTEFTAPLALFTTEQNLDQPRVTVSLWRSETKTIVPISAGATAVIVPKAAVSSIQRQLYDWPYIDKTQIMLKSQPLDIVFVSNGEPNADENFQILRNRVAFRANRLHRVDGITGRVAAYHAAARASGTPWFFAVFAKLRQNTDFDWDWQPDRMQQAKHYIFHARNPVNGLVYGHQAMIAYNRQLVLDNSGVGLDFTLDSPHEVVPVVSGTAYYNTSAWSAWRTAFREVIKLRHSLPDVENEYRIAQWLRPNQDSEHMVFEDWSPWGAEDALEYYDSVGGDFEKLRLSYDWAWLASYAFIKRKITPHD